MAPYTPEDVERAEDMDSTELSREAGNPFGERYLAADRGSGAVRSDKGQSLLDRTAAAIQDRNKLVAELLAHAKRHLAESKRHEREATEATNTANILLGIKPEKAKPQGEQDTPMVKFLFNTKREMLSFGKLAGLIAVGCGLIALGWMMGNG